MIVLDANILIRAVLGARVNAILDRYVGLVDFAAPDTAFREATEHLPRIAAIRGVSAEPLMGALDQLAKFIGIVDAAVYGGFEISARRRLANRDEEDWTVLASALALGAPIWTEDRDFFGCGVPTWTTDRIEIYLPEASEATD